jgi:amidase
VTDLEFLDATAQSELVRRGELTPVELVDAAIARIEASNPHVNAVVHERFQRAHDEAANATAGPFCGVPVVVKDHDGPLAGEPYHHGNRLLKEIGYTANCDSYLVAKMKRAGFVVVGKTNTPEFGLLPTTEPAVYGPTRNPWDPQRSAGGSSGGSASAVAAGMVPVGHGGDGGGSLRIPASMCGLFALKPTRGRVSLGPDEGEAWSGLVVRHVLTRSVRDSAAVLDVIAGAMPGDPYAAPAHERPFLDEVRAEPPALRIGVRSDRAPGALAEVAADCARATEAVAALLDTLGHHVTPSSPDALDDIAALLAFSAIRQTAIAHDVADLARTAGRDVRRDDVEPLTWTLYDSGRTIAAADYVAALESARAWSRRMARWWDADGDGFDVLLTPTLAEPPPLLGDIDSTGPDPSHALARVIPFGVFTAPFNLTGQPAVSLPAPTHIHLPIGVQLVGASGREGVLLRLAAQLERAIPWSFPAPGRGSVTAAAFRHGM